MLWHSHNSLLSMGYFVQVVIWVVSDKNNLKWKIETTSATYFKVSFITNDPSDNLYKISDWKKWIVGRQWHLLWMRLFYHTWQVWIVLENMHLLQTHKGVFLISWQGMEENKEICKTEKTKRKYAIWFG